jgi:hypothetical protein
MKRVLPFLLTLVLFVAPAAAEKLVVGLPEPGRLPFFRQDSPQRYSGTYVTLLEKIGALAGWKSNSGWSPKPASSSSSPRV